MLKKIFIRQQLERRFTSSYCEWLKQRKSDSLIVETSCIDLQSHLNFLENDRLLQYVVFDITQSWDCSLKVDWNEFDWNDNVLWTFQPERELSIDFYFWIAAVEAAVW